MRKLRESFVGIAGILVAFLAMSIVALLSGGSAFAKNIDIDASEYGYGTYVVRARGIGERGVFDEDTVVFYYVPLVATVVEDDKTGDYYIDLDYVADDGTEETAGNVKTITINIYDENGDLITSLSPIKVMAPANRAELLMEEKDMPTGNYIVEAIAYDAEGEMIYQPYRTQFYYEKIEVPDTGSFFGQLNITKSDYLITGMIVFMSAVVVGMLIIVKTGKVKSHAKATKSNRIAARSTRMANRNTKAAKAKRATRTIKSARATRSRKR